MILEIPKNAETILHILEKAGYEAYVVGGCVRDSILGRSPDDWDITTSGKAGAGQGFVSQNSGYRSAAWNSDCSYGKRRI